MKDIAIVTRAAGGVINRRQILIITKGVVEANKPSSLKKFAGTQELTDRWARDLLDYIEWNKRKGATGKIERWPQFLFEEKFTLQRAICTAVFEHDISIPLIVNLDQTPFSYVLPGISIHLALGDPRMFPLRERTFRDRSPGLSMLL